VDVFENSLLLATNPKTGRALHARDTASLKFVNAHSAAIQMARRGRRGSKRVYIAPITTIGIFIARQHGVKEIFSVSLHFDMFG
jgi:hypothetical protein